MLLKDGEQVVKLTATYEEQTFKRSTDRTYTHVLIIKDEGEAWRAVSWAGSLLLAQKKIKEFTREGREVKIIPTDEERIKEMMNKKIADTVKCNFPGIGKE